MEERIPALGITSLSEFRYFAKAAEKLEGLFLPRDNLDNPRVLRIRHCWTATWVES